MRRIIIALLAAAPLLWAQARADVSDHERECKYVRGDEGIHACTALLTEVQWGTNETAWLYFSRGSDYLMQGKDQMALSDLNEAIKEAPAFIDAYLNRAQVYRRAGQQQLAKADLDTVIAIPTSTTYTEVNNGDSNSIRYRITPSDTARMSRAEIEIDLGDIAGAVADIDVAKRRAPRNPIAESVSCWVHALKGDQLDTALADCDDALDETPDDEDFLYRRGIAHYRMGDFSAAVNDLDRSLKIDSENGRARYVRGLAKAKSGDAAGGKADTDAAIAAAPRVGTFFAQYGVAP